MSDEVRVTVRGEDDEVIGDWITNEDGEHRPVHELRRTFQASVPRIVCLCGSTRFFDQFMAANYALTMQGVIVLSVGFYHHLAAEVHGTLHGEDVGVETDEQKVALDELHKRKIDLADEIFVLNVDGYIGDSTRSEIEYAESHDKPVRYLEPIDSAG